MTGSKSTSSSLSGPAAGRAPPPLIRFGLFQLDHAAGQLLRNGRIVPIKPQPLKVLQLLASRPGEVVTREDIRHLLWGTDTFVDFDQGVNAAIKGIRDALGEDADRPLYIETVPKRGYRFIAPVETASGSFPAMLDIPRTDLNLHKALWLNIAEIRLAEARRRSLRRRVLVATAVAAVLLLVVLLIYLLVLRPDASLGGH